LQRKCLLMTQSGHEEAFPDARLSRYDARS